MAAATATAPAPTTKTDGKTAGGTYKVWISEAGGKALETREVAHKVLEEDEVEVKIVASGICGSDVDCLSGKYPPQMFPFPLVAGHEGVGTVSAIGKAVRTLKVGARVGLGVYRDACLSCIECSKGENNLCNKKLMMFSAGAHGTFAEYVRIKAAFAVPIPDEIVDLESAGPLMCGGITVFAPFINHNIKAGDRVAVMGIGGLGHLALKIANKWGCIVSALSRALDKKDELIAMGAHHFVDTKADPELKTVVNHYDYILVTLTGEVNWKSLLLALRAGGKVILMGNPGLAGIVLDPMLLVLGQKTVAGSASGGLAAVKQMFHFCAAHKILPQVEKFSFSQINEAIAKVKAGTLRYRAVVVHDKK